ncbi:chemotaxis protein [Piscirickettsia litoralis]|uniref:Response regulator n=1 Tax=Piscirickettsia litoralis TaxID=1891921 RepID=A0ABX3A3K4_9GAMM|nr:chemotaxis protein [Piscirickettsia litoralis]ODN43444.1 response regulator [Piscirickettsia litoralis]
MPDILASVDARTQLVGRNRLEILLFHLDDQLFGINVFKIREVINVPSLTQLPNSHESVIGATSIRGTTMPVIDLNKAVNDEYTYDLDDKVLIITEYNRSVQGLVVYGVEHIVNASWESIVPPPPATGRDHYITGVAKGLSQVEDRLVELLDVERVLGDINDMEADFNVDSVDDLDEIIKKVAHKYTVLVADDSTLARRHVKRTLDQIGVNVIMTDDGQHALDILEHDIPRTAGDVSRKYLMLISDVEMPEMDGYSLIKKCREHPGLKNLFIMLNTSITSVFNEADSKEVGCNEFVGKINPQKIYDTVKEQIQVRINKAANK